MYYKPFHKDFIDEGFTCPVFKEQNFKKTKSVFSRVMRVIKSCLADGDEERFDDALDKLLLSPKDIKDEKCNLV